MFPSPQERSRLNRMHRELHSGITPTQFGLEIERYHNLLEEAAQVATTDTASPQPVSGMVRTILQVMDAAFRRRLRTTFELR